MGLRVLFVCTGNTCRSPMAEWAATSYFARKLGLSRMRLESSPSSAAKVKKGAEEMGFVARSGGISDKSNPHGCELGEGADLARERYEYT